LDRHSIDCVEKTLRFVVQDVYNKSGERITVGRVESGILKRYDEVIFEPSGIRGRIEKIKVFGGELEEAGEGDCIGVIFNGMLKRGDVCGLVNDHPPIPKGEFVGVVYLLDNKLRRGDQLELRCGTKKAKCEIKEIHEKIDSETGEILEKNSDEIIEHDEAKIVFDTELLVVERFTDIPKLGRFVLAKDDKNIGLGIVLDV
jgi:elongation factor 1-alpha